VVGHPLRLRVRVPRHRCVTTGCPREVFAHNTSRLARPGASTTRRSARYILRRLMIDRIDAVNVINNVKDQPFAGAHSDIRKPALAQLAVAAAAHA